MSESLQGSTDLYRYFDADGRLLYVGISFSAVARAAQHRHDKGWWAEFTTMTVERHSTRSAAMAAELHAIRTERPRHNVVGNRTASPSGSPRFFAVGNNRIMVTPGRIRRAEWGGLEILIRSCPECGEKHRHGVRDDELHRGVAYRFPHCYEIRRRGIEPWQIITFRRMDIQVDPARSDDFTRRGSERQWSHRRFRVWAERVARESVA